MRTRQNDGLGRILDQIRERGGGISQCVRAVRNDESVVFRIVFLNNSRERQPMRGADVGAVDMEGLNGIQFANGFCLGNVAEQILGV